VSFRVGITRDLIGAGGRPVYDIGLHMLEEAGHTWEFLARDEPELSPDLVQGFDALLVWAPFVTRRTLDGADRLKVVSRLGVGFDNVDVAACAERGIRVTITPDAVRRPVASAAVMLILALAHALPQKERLIRAGRWAERFASLGGGLTGKTVGVVGLGNIGREICRLLAPFDVRLVAADPYARPLDGVDLVELDRLLEESDFVVIVTPLNEETRHLVDATRLALMKHTAFLVNVARGPVVDQAALTQALRERRIAGAALDVFEQEPIAPDDPLLALDNVILAPHMIAVTEETVRALGESACRAVLAVAAGREPEFVVRQ
jgi:phosphoglycerate dehydrogenase-like enzyme